MAAKPRVLVLTPDFPPAPGGIQLLLHRVTVTMSRLEPLVVAPREADEHVDGSDGLQVHRVSRVPRDHRGTILRLNAVALAVAHRFRPDVVLSAHIVTSPAASMIRKQLNVPVVQYLHANEVGARPRLAEFAMARSDAVIAVSRHTRALAERAGASPAVIHVITPGVDLPPRQPRSRCDVPTILTVARLEDRYKGHDTVVRALPLVRARVGDVQWVVIGSGPRRDQLERLATIYGVSEHARFLGELSDQERDGWFERAHVFTMPSRVPGDGLGGEGFGIVYMEAAWHELPVVAGNAGGAVDAVVDGETGLLVDANDPVAVGDALTMLLRDEQLRRRFGKQGALRAQDFSWPIIAGRVEDLLLSVVGGGELPAQARTAQRSRFCS